MAKITVRERIREALANMPQPATSAEICARAGINRNSGMISKAAAHGDIEFAGFRPHPTNPIGRIALYKMPDVDHA